MLLEHPQRTWALMFFSIPGFHVTYPFHRIPQHQPRQAPAADIAESFGFSPDC